MTNLQDAFSAAMPPGFDAPNTGAGMNVEYDTNGNVVGVARTEEERFAARAAQLVAMRDAGGAAGVLDTPRLDADDRRKALPVLSTLGVETPPLVADALTRAGQVELALVPKNPYLDIRTVPVEEIADRVSEHIADSLRETMLHTVSRRLRNDAATEIVSAFRGSLSHVLAEDAVRAEFDSARDAFLDSFPVVSGCRSIGDAAGLDETGAGVGAWHTARKAVARMDRVVDLLVWFAAPAKSAAVGALRREMEPGAVLGLSAAPAAMGAYLGALAARGIDFHEHFRKPVDEAFGLYGAQLEAGAVLSLPVDADELAARAAEFNPYAAIADAMLADG